MNTNAFASETLATDGLTLNVEISIDDEYGNPAPLAADVAKDVLVAAGVPVVGRVTLTAFEGMFFVNVPQAWWVELEESGDDFDATTAYHRVHICTY